MLWVAGMVYELLLVIALGAVGILAARHARRHR